jgi:hypothetical protein
MTVAPCRISQAVLIRCTKQVLCSPSSIFPVTFLQRSTQLSVDQSPLARTWNLETLGVNEAWTHPVRSHQSILCWKRVFPQTSKETKSGSGPQSASCQNQCDPGRR